MEGKTISATNIKKAREQLKSYKAEKDEFLFNFRRTKQDSTNSYMKMLEELVNLKKPKNTTCKDSLNRNPSAVSSKLLLESLGFDMIKLNQENIQKIQADLDVMMKTQESIHTALKKLSFNQEKIQLEPKTELEDKFRHSSPGAFDE